MVKIISPLDNLSEAEDLIEAGADEFYCGLTSENWDRIYFPASMDRRPKGNAHLKAAGDLKEVISIAHSKNVLVNLTINEHYYIREQYPIIEDLISYAMDLNIDAIIISDIALLLYLKEKEIKVNIHISTGGVCLNPQTAAFYKEMGALKIILPRHLRMDEIKLLGRESKDIELETFILNSRCVNIDGLCTFQHGLSGPKVPHFYRNACMLPYKITAYTREDDEKKKDLITKKQKVWERIHIDDHPCGVCALYEFEKSGISSVKIVGRGNTLERKVRDLVFLKEAREILKANNLSFREYMKNVKASYTRNYGKPCKPEMCYYPDMTEYRTTR